MTAEVMTSKNDRKFIPVLRSGEWTHSAPAWLAGKYYINLSGHPYSERDYEDLVRTLLGMREVAPTLGNPMATLQAKQSADTGETMAIPQELEDIRITRVIVEDVTEPRNDGTRGSGLYSIPFALSRRPSFEWSKLFLQNWDHPPRWTNMHRSGIAEINGSTISLNGTTIDEVERYHRDTLQLAVEQTNQQYRELKRRRDEKRTLEKAQNKEHRRRIEEAVKKIKFD